MEKIVGLKRIDGFNSGMVALQYNNAAKEGAAGRTMALVEACCHSNDAPGTAIPKP
jgi:hypothetical protein